MQAQPVPAEDLPQVLVAIVATNEVHNIVGCLGSLAASTHRDFGVVICENGGAEAFDRAAATLAAQDFIGAPSPAGDRPAAGWARRRQDFVLAPGRQPVTLFEAPRNLGYAGGVNACIGAGAGRWQAVWVLNPDTFPEPGALAALARRQQAGGYGIVGSRLLFAGSGLVQTWGGLEWRPWLGRGRLLGFNQPPETMPDIADIERRIAFISGASMYVTRAYIDAVGVMDDDFFVFDEDVEWCLRRHTLRLGYAHDSVVRHVHGATSGSSTAKTRRSRFNIYLTERNRVLIARKRFGAGWPLLAAIALGETLEHLLRVGSPRQFGIALAGWWAGVRGETGAPPFLQNGRAAR